MFGSNGRQTIVQAGMRHMQVGQVAMDGVSSRSNCHPDPAAGTPEKQEKLFDNGKYGTMCCRYHIEESESDYLKGLGADTIRSGDVHPGDRAPAVLACEAKPVVAMLRWGIASTGKTLVINARSETLWEKRMFHENILRRRCVLPATSFYEWDNRKRKNTFWPSAGGLLFLAGIYNSSGNFVIITGNADSVMQPVHDRMPICLPQSLLHDWLFNADKSRSILEASKVQLYRQKPPEQALLWD